jgi:hypothetical protein
MRGPFVGVIVPACPYLKSRVFDERRRENLPNCTSAADECRHNQLVYAKAQRRSGTEDLGDKECDDREARGAAGRERLHMDKQRKYNVQTYPTDKYKYSRRGLAASVRRLEEPRISGPPAAPWARRH